MTKTKVTIETINNKLVTIIRKPFDAGWVKEQLDMGVPVLVEDTDLRKFILNEFISCETMPFFKSYCFENHEATHRSFYGLEYIITILPALPKHPKPEDAPLLHKYMVEGIYLQGIILNLSWRQFPKADALEWLIYLKTVEFEEPHNFEITHATLDGERVEIAINVGVSDD